MQSLFKQNAQRLFSPTDRILLAVSGGIDSVVMAELFHRSNFDFAIAHCNFQLRGEDSDKDELFVKELSNVYNVPFFCAKFNTEKEAKEKKVSIQMAARDLRYTWFAGISEKENFDFIATAHHADDVMETFFINLIRGTGIAGLHGIPEKQNNIIRPLLFATRNQISEFAEKENIAFHEDKSNDSDKYIRNKIRHHLIPTLRQISDSADKGLLKSIEILSETEHIFRKEIESAKNKIVSEKDHLIFINISALLQLDNQKTYLFEILSAYGFSFVTVENILENANGVSGQQYFSKTHRLIKDREYFIISKDQDKDNNNYLCLDPLKL